MARRNCKILDTGDSFPEITLNVTDGSTISLPGYFEGQWGIFLIYRGNW
jgi:peroxiredoxin